MSEFNLALNAIINKKEQPNHLYVHGSVMVFTEESTAKLTKAEPQGINPNVLILNLTIIANPGKMKGVAYPLKYDDSGDHVNEYEQVQVVTDQAAYLYDIEILG
ncbi:hypothetical protein [Cerasicoccus arenae]|uniref:Uncharacterized protein n=1 Tax=Cerasicoccus arenae TaxID=424488 RepID=A0A8J3DHR9_9BACT|nr:hypothetical protein [Cerasicoccus arenae]MBK1858207.1 hypothetical protein [Cerasicoccus arenae]GHC01909.1 hypothetical protein GCM10007047_17950 [Cerasicoccus arenae]